MIYLKLQGVPKYYKKFSERFGFWDNVIEFGQWLPDDFIEIFDKYCFVADPNTYDERMSESEKAISAMKLLPSVKAACKYLYSNYIIPNQRVNIEIIKVKQVWSIQFIYS